MSGPPTSWEYRVVSARDEPDLNGLGRAGWELVGVATDGGVARLYFKRPLPSFRERVTLDQKRRYYGLWGIRLDERTGGVAGSEQADR